MAKNLFEEIIYDKFPKMLDEEKYGDILLQIANIEKDTPSFFSSSDKYNIKIVQQFLDDLKLNLAFMLNLEDDNRFPKYMLYLSFRCYDKSIAIIEQLLNEEPFELRYLEEAARVYYFDNNYEEALSCAQKILSLDDNTKVGNCVAAACYAYNNDAEKTTKHIKQLILDNLNDVACWKFSRNTQSIRKIIEYPHLIISIFEENRDKINDFDVKLYIQKAYLYKQKISENQEMFNKAKVILDELYIEQPENPKLLSELSDYWEKADKLKTAIRFAKKACSVSEKELPFVRLASLYSKIDDKKAALANYLKANKITFSPYIVENILNISSEIDEKIYSKTIDELISNNELQILVDHYIKIGENSYSTKVFLSDFSNMKAHSKNLSGKTYFIYKIFEITDDFVNKDDCRKKIIYFYDTIYNIKNRLKFTVWNDQKICHYSKIDSLQYLLAKDSNENKSRFRVYNSAYMNDPSEGVAFLDILKDISPSSNEVIEILYPYTFNDIQGEYTYSNTYLGSFSLAKDRLPMWIQYGDDGYGCCYVIDKDFFNQKRGIDVDFDCFDKSENEVESQNDLPNLFRVRYIDFSKDNKIQQRIYEQFEKIGSSLDALKSWIIDNTQIKNIVVSLIDQIRFLYKDTAYLHEDEVRIIMTPSDDYVKETVTNVNNAVPKLYVEIDNGLKCEEIILGPKLQKPMDIVPYAMRSGRVGKITKSKIKYQ